MLHMTLRDAVLAAAGRDGVALMGICNVTPDSFSDGGLAFGAQAARARIDELIREGATVVDIGAESTRAGAPRMSAAEQLDRIGDALRYASARVLTSVDTTRAEVAAEALRQGASMVNDVSMGADDAVALSALVSRTGAAWCLSHARGTQSSMSGFGGYDESAYGDNVVATVQAELRTAMNQVVGLGVDARALLPDPGLGFDKSGAHSMRVLECLPALSKAFDGWLLVGASRKSFLNEVAQHKPAPSERLGASIAAALWARESGVALVRVHDVGQTLHALRLSARLHAARSDQEHAHA